MIEGNDPGRTRPSLHDGYPMIRFNLLGEIGLTRADGTPVDQLLRQPKRLALLAYLVAPVPGTWHRRDTLLALFWPDLDTAHARTALRNALYVLRQVLGEATLRSRGQEEVSVDPAEMSTDLAALRAALEASRADEALAHYRGELLPGLHASDSGGFQDWLDAERTRIRLEVAKAGMEWAAGLEREGRLAEAARVARRVLEVHPDDEPAVRRLMQLHDLMGDRAGALGAFEEYRSRLAREFEAVPAPETVALAERLREPASPGAPQRRAPGGEPAPPTPGPSPTAGLTGPAGRPRPAARRSWVGLLGGLVLITAGGLGWGLLRAPRPAAIGPSVPLTFDEGLQIEPAISPNGRLVAYAKGTSRRMRIFVHGIAGGVPWPLSGDSSSVELMPRWSPDGDQLLFLSRNGAWVAPAVGGAPRLVAAGGPDEDAVRSASWSPGGDSVAIVRRDSLTVRPLEGSGSRFIGTGPQLHSCVWSPDGRWIACVSGNWIAFVPGTLFGNRAPSAILLFPAAGGPPIQLTDSEKEHQSPAWSDDSRHLWVLSNRDGPSGEVYAIPIGRNGRGRGPDVRIGLRAESISLSAGRIAYSVYSRRANIWSVPAPTGAPLTLRDATRVTTGNQIIEVLRASPDGRWLVYDSNLRGNSDIYRVPTDGGPPERLTDDPREEFAGDLSPDLRELAHHVWVGGMRRVVVRRLDTGVTSEPVPAAGDQGVPRWSPRGDALAIWDHAREPGSIFVVRRDGEGRWGPVAWTLADAQLPVWSPDGGELAFVLPAGTIEVIAADSGARRMLHAPRPGADDPLATYLAWDPARDALWFLGHTATQAGIWSLRRRGGAPRLAVDLHDEDGRVNGPTLAFDGRRLYFTLDERQGNVRWAELVPR